MLHQIFLSHSQRGPFPSRLLGQLVLFLQCFWFVVQRLSVCDLLCVVCLITWVVVILIWFCLLFRDDIICAFFVYLVLFPLIFRVVLASYSVSLYDGLLMVENMCSITCLCLCYCDFNVVQVVFIGVEKEISQTSKFISRKSEERKGMKWQDMTRAVIILNISNACELFMNYSNNSWIIQWIIHLEI